MVRIVALFIICAAVMFSSCQTNQEPDLTIDPLPIPTATVEPTATSTSLLSFQPTLVPSATSRPKPDPTPFVSFIGPVVAFNQLSESLWLYDLGTQSSRRLTFKDGYPHSVQWIENGCQLYVALVNPVNSKTTIVRTDLLGNIKEEVYQTPMQHPGRQEIYGGRWSISLGGDWLAFIAFGGEQYYSGSEFEDVVVIRHVNPQEPITLTVQHGGSNYAWSPDGQRIAYVDYDDRSVKQLYVADVGHDKQVQLSRFVGQTDTQELPKNNVGGPVWSPNGKMVGIYESTRDKNGTVWLFSANGEPQLRIAVTSLPVVSWMGWSDDSTTLAFYSRSDTTRDGLQPAIYWIHAIDGKVLRTFTAAELPKLSYSSVFSFRGVQLLGLTNYSRGDESYAYDYQSNRLMPIDIPDLLENPDFVEVVTAPSSFPGEAVCAQAAK